MATYRVELLRTAYRIAEIEIEANSIEEATALALEKADDPMFRSCPWTRIRLTNCDEYDAGYDVNSVVEVDESKVR